MRTLLIIVLALLPIVRTFSAIEISGMSLVTQPAWDDTIVPPLATRTGVTAPAFESFNAAGGLYMFTFQADTANDQVYFSIQMPHAWLAGSELRPHVHWCQTAAPSGTNTNVVWGLEYSFCPINGTFATNSIIYVTNGVSGVNWNHQVAALPAISQATNGISSVLVGRIFRGGTYTEDNYGSPACLLGFDIHYINDSIGSKSEYTK